MLPCIARIAPVAFALFGAAPTLAQSFEPLEAEIQIEDAERFVRVFEATNGTPTADQLQEGYLDGAGKGVAIFNPGRIESAENLARRIAADPDKYRRAIDVCLPMAKAANADLRSIYLALASIFPDRPLPEVHFVFGAGNSGGTAGPGAQVIGLEVICEVADGPEEIRTLYRKFFAHETVHVLQGTDGGSAARRRDPLLAGSLREGVADFIAALVTGSAPMPARDQWASEREASVWKTFARDRDALRKMVADGASFDDPPPEGVAIYRRWLANYKNAPDGWPYELGYWVGRRIATAYFERAEDKRQAIEELLELRDVDAILEASGYADRLADDPAQPLP